jgi:hypothetical protein
VLGNDSKTPKRIAALEVPTAPGEPLTIIRRFVAPGKLQDEMNGMRYTKGTVWRREPGESEQDLIDRASIHAWRNSRGVANMTSI